MGVRCPSSGAADPGLVIKISFLRIKRLPFTAVTSRLLIRVGAGFAQARWSFTGSPSTVRAQPLRAQVSVEAGPPPRWLLLGLKLHG